MSVWISVDSAIEPPVHNLRQCDIYFYSARYPVLIEGCKGWRPGYFIKSKDGEFKEWRAEGFIGEYKITHYCDLRVPEGLEK